MQFQGNMMNIPPSLMIGAWQEVIFNCIVIFFGLWVLYSLWHEEGLLRNLLLAIIQWFKGNRIAGYELKTPEIKGEFLDTSKNVEYAKAPGFIGASTVNSQKDGQKWVEAFIKERNQHKAFSIGVQVWPDETDEKSHHVWTTLNVHDWEAYKTLSKITFYFGNALNFNTYAFKPSASEIGVYLKATEPLLCHCKIEFDGDVEPRILSQWIGLDTGEMIRKNRVPINLVRSTPHPLPLSALASLREPPIRPTGKMRLPHHICYTAAHILAMQ